MLLFTTNKAEVENLTAITQEGVSNVIHGQRITHNIH